MQSTDALVLQSQSTRPCLHFSRLKLYRIHLLAGFKLSSFTIPHTTLNTSCLIIQGRWRMGTATVLKWKAKLWITCLFCLLLYFWIFFHFAVNYVFVNSGFSVMCESKVYDDFSFSQWSMSYSCRKLRNSAEQNFTSDNDFCQCVKCGPFKLSDSASSPFAASFLSMTYMIFFHSLQQHQHSLLVSLVNHL